MRPKGHFAWYVASNIVAFALIVLGVYNYIYQALGTPHTAWGFMCTAVLIIVFINQPFHGTGNGKDIRSA